MKKITLEIPEEHKEEVCHLLRWALMAQASTNWVWTNIHEFCNTHSDIKLDDSNALIEYSATHDNLKGE